MNNGFIKWYRKILDWQWYTDIPTHILFEHLLLTANWQDSKWKNITIKRGQRVTSLQHLSQETGLSVQQVRTSLNKLKSSGDITSKATNKNTLITIANYDLYQFEMEETTNEITNKQQTNNKQITTNEEYKEYKEYKNNNIKEKYKKENAEPKIHFAEFVSMTNVEYEKLINTYGEETANQCIEVLDNYKGSSGKKYKSDYRAILSWVIDKVSKPKQEKSRDTSWKDLIDKVWEESNK